MPTNWGLKHILYKGFFNVQFHTKMYSSKKICAVLMKEMSNAKAYLAVHWRKEVNTSKIGRLRYEMIG